ncbi:sulfite exporter TauE/SafE family protein [Geodermatophilus sp. URMC 61]|uniref:sulfite exporter TauE/SafE family protein n=1 Tax=Geodermatophilus sp. URMC 61 TaxID=3423411 RepID=UPI00406D1521
MDLQFTLIVAGLLIGVVVGMTGMGGGALMTPVLVLFFNVPPVAAVSSDLVVSAVMKPVGAGVHLRRGTVDLRLVGLLCLGSVPAAFCGVLVIRALGSSAAVQDGTKTALGIALLLAAIGLIVRAYQALVARGRRAAERATRRAGEVVAPPTEPLAGPLRLRPVPTVLVGVVGGLVVGMTSVGSGSLIIIALLVLYPRLSAAGLVGTDLVQAVPLVASAALGHLLFGDFRLDLTASLLVGCLPGVYLGARLSSRAPGGLVRRALALVLLASGLKLLELPDLAMVGTLGTVVVIGPLLWMLARNRHGLPARARILAQARERRRADSSGAVGVPSRSTPVTAAPRG